MVGLCLDVTRSVTWARAGLLKMIFFVSVLKDVVVETMVLNWLRWDINCESVGRQI